ncbi:hypothetical protein LSAT2_031703 [Lamellibrachia satsuma]|nr:hypothetical protein LSAT2_031703 [Lamellibrachia satsuma]
MLCDLNALTNDEHRWTPEDKFNLESQILLATSGPLCLHPSPAVGFVTNILNYERQKLGTHSLKRSVRKCSQAAVSRRRKMAQCPAPAHLRLHDFVCRKKEKLKPVPHVNLKVGKTCVDMWRQRDVELIVPETIEVEKYAKALEKPKLTLDNTPVTVEEFTLETERSHGKVNYSRLTILQRLSDECYSGMLYVDRDYTEGTSEGSTCRFPLGTKANVEKYITQFREIFTEEGRRQVKITHQVLGQPPTVSYTQNTQTGVQVTVTGAGPLLTQAAGLAATITGQLTVPGLSGDGNTGQKVQPIKLSLSLNPQVSVAPGNLVSPQGAAVQAGPVMGQAQLTLNIQQQPHPAAPVGQRGRQMYAGVSRPASTPSPVSVATVSSAQLPTYAQATASLTSTSATGTPVGLPKATTPGASATPSTTPSPTTPGNAAQSLPQVVNVGSFLQGDGASGIVGKLSTTSLNVMPPGITLGSLAGMSQNFNLASLQGLQNLQNVQVSLGSVTLPGGIAVPLSMINTTPSLSTPTGLLVSSLTSGHSATVVSGSTDVDSSLSAPLISSSVTMATAIPAVTLATSSSASAASGLLTSPTQVLSTPSGLLSLPIGVAGNLTQFMAAAGLKTAQGIRPGAPLFLSQIPGQQSVQLLSAADFPQASRAQLGVAPQGGRRQSGGGLAGRAGTSVSGSVILTAQTGQSHGDGGLQVRTSSQALTTQQLMQTSLQLASGQSATLTSQQVMQLTPQQQQQVAAQLALQKQQLAKSPQVAIAATRVQHGSLPSKSKSKKRSQSNSQK